MVDDCFVYVIELSYNKIYHRYSHIRFASDAKFQSQKNGVILYDRNLAVILLS